MSKYRRELKAPTPTYGFINVYCGQLKPWFHGKINYFKES